MQQHPSPTRQLTSILFLLILQQHSISVRGRCNLAAVSARPDFYGHCPCNCQNITKQLCSECPVTCKGYFEICQPTKACLSPPPETTGVTWRPICNKVAVGAKCYGDCLPGYYGTGATSQCTTDGWTAPANRCTQTAAAAAAKTSQLQPVASLGSAAAAVSCKGLARKASNAVYWPASCKNAAVRTLCTSKCIPGYSGQAITRCQANGKWQTAVNTCRPTSSTRQQQHEGSLAVAEAAPLVDGPAAAEAAAAAAANKIPQVASASGPITCAGLPAAVSNTLGWPGSCENSSMGASCFTKCQAGFQGRAIAICLSSGSWSAAVNHCKKVCVGSPSNSPSVRWQACDGTRQGQSCTAPCPFDSIGAGYSAVCGADGVWQQPKVQCREVFCRGSPPATAGVNWPDCTGHRVGESCVANRCAEGFMGTGAIANCMPDGTWYDLWTDCAAV